MFPLLIVAAFATPPWAPEPPVPPVVAAAPAPPSPTTPPGGGGDPIAERLFPPEAIMQRQKELGVTEKQRNAIIGEMQKFQSEIVGVQWQLQAAAEDLAAMLDAPAIDEAKALAQADKVMDLEHKMKRTHLGLLIRLRNLLTEEQRAKLRN